MCWITGLSLAEQTDRVVLLFPIFPPATTSQIQTTTGFLRYLFPSTRQRLSDRLDKFKRTRLPAVKHGVKSRIWSFLAKRYLRKAQGRPPGVLETFRRRSRSAFARARSHERLPGRGDLDSEIATGSKTMNSYGYGGGGQGQQGQQQATGSNGYGVNGGAERQVGARREKLRGYLRAANELRQSYMQNYSTGWDNRDSRGGDLAGGTPGAYPDMAVVHGEDEEMILFPSYARKHSRLRLTPQSSTSDLNRRNTQDASAQQRSTGASDNGGGDTWKQQWEEYEEKDAIVDVDVRGWIFTPHRGPMSRRQRFYFSLARQLAGLPNPTPGAKSPNGSPSESRSTSPKRSHLADKMEEKAARHEAEAVSREADRILQQGEAETEIASRGGYSEEPGRRGSDSSLNTLRPNNRTESGTNLRRLAASNASGEKDESLSITPVQKRASWPAVANMDPTQLATAHGHLNDRLRPFISNPAANVPISAFFYNDKISRQRTIYTNASGHFALRASLDFLPTHVRILASEKLSATEEVKITDPYGISVISDIDDTIKHTSMVSGAREIFRNAFIRELADLTIEGVEDWYGRMAKAGVMFHYVSNSPWQLYPALTQYFSVAKLPPGSVHLKLYSGMLQGIFEPVAERKKSTIDRLARDFPDRKFILIGDSGEADLEVYTDFVMENPGRVLAVFIRDVTTPVDQQGFFDPSNSSPQKNNGGRLGSMSGPGGRSSDPRRSSAPAMADDDDDPDLRAAIAASLRDMELSERKNRPSLPPRLPTIQASKPLDELENLIDLDSPPASGAASPALSRTHTDTDLQSLVAPVSTGLHRSHPVKPKKPAMLRSAPSPANLDKVVSHDTASSTASSITDKKPAPPKPRRPSTSIRVVEGDQQSPPRRSSAQQPPILPDRKPTTYTDMAVNKISAAYNKLPSAQSLWSNATPSDSNNFNQARPMSTSSNNGPKPSDSDTSPDKKPLKHSSTFSSIESDTTDHPSQRPNIPPRRPVSAYPIAAAQNVGSRVASAWNSYTSNPSTDNNDLTQVPTNSSYRTTDGYSIYSGQNNGPASPTISKRETLWRQRWQRAEYILKDRGVLLKSWRVGGDVADECLGLVEKWESKMGQARERAERASNGAGGGAPIGEGMRRARGV